MTEPPAQTDEFEELDALLEQAYELDEPARTRFVEGLPEPYRGRLQQLLQLSHSLTLKGIAADAQAVLEDAEPPASEPAVATVAVPTATAGRWRLHREIGSGGMGQVFYATREAPEGTANGGSDFVQEAAIKVLWSLKADHEVRARFLRERRLLASLHHPGLARFVDGGFLGDGRPWFAMEYVAGSTIDAYCKDQSLEARLKLFKDVCATVAHAHQHLIVHRDIKPMNVLVDESGRARLLDFGIAGVLEDIDDGVRTRTAGGPLTLQYASPEQLMGGVVTVASDIYQLGLMLYQMLTDKLPYDLEDAPLAEALAAICERIPPKPSVHSDAVSRDLDAIVSTALAKNPDERYRSASDLAEDIDRYLDGRPVRAVRQTTWYVARRFLRRNAVVASILGFAATALTVATIVSVRMANEAVAQAQRSQAAQRILTDVFQKADPFKAQGGSVTLAQALVRAKPDIAARVASDPLLAWEVNLTLAKIYESLGAADEELGAYERALKAARSLGGESRHRILKAVAGIGSVLARTNPVEAVRYFDAELPAQPPSARAAGPWLDAQYAYVGALARVGEYGRADAGTLAMAEAMDAFDVQRPRKRGRLSQLLAGAAKRAGDTEQENRHWQDTVRYMRAADSPAALAVTLNNWAIYLGRQKRYAESEAAFREALSIFEDAALEDPTFATVLRGYAGLLFRTGRVDEAIAATKRALSLLPESSQAYGRFVAERNLAQYSLVAGDVDTTIDVLTRAIAAARRAFADDPAVPQRMARLFAKTMFFAQRYDLAAMSLGFASGECRAIDRLVKALEAREHPNDRPRRAPIWAGLASLEQKGRSGSVDFADLDPFLALYDREVPAFFDALDHWRVLDRLVALPVATSLPAEVKARYEALTASRQKAAARARRTPELSDMAAYLQAGAKSSDCP